MFSILHSLIDPWTATELRIYWPIIVQGAMVSVTLGLIGCFLVVRGMSLLGDALSHAVLPGVVIGFLLGGSLHSPWILIGASAVGMVAAVLVQAVQEHSRVKEDASLGIVFTTLFAIGVVMVNLYGGSGDLDVGCVLYGNLEHFIYPDNPLSMMLPMIGLTIAVVVGLIVFFRRLVLCTFDPGLAVSLGINAALVHYALMGVLSVTVVASFESVGAILAVALLVMPGATARLWTDRMSIMLLLAAGQALLATVLGYWISSPLGPLRAFQGTSAAGAICAMGFAIFILSWLLGPRGLAQRVIARVRLQRTIAVENVLKTIDELGARAGLSGAVPVPPETVAAELRVSPRAFQRALKRGIERGWVAMSMRNVFLTDAGAARSSRLRRAHDLWEQYLKDQVGLPADHVHDAAEWIEHHLHDEDIDTIDRTLATPRP
ncbi:MAG TPA: metal ABC transporter permease [Tepidisphaeraceae bacterium]|jgi:manganese/zinc/iron transport system permease protein|nr:metal ABC transporter permease [Tepidisphaeraceae bacterium]